MNFRVDIERLREDGEHIISFAQNNIYTKYDEMISLLDHFNWQGNSRDVFDENYKKTMEDIKEIYDAVIKIGSFLVVCSEHFNESEEQIMHSWMDYLNEFFSQKDRMF